MGRISLTSSLPDMIHLVREDLWPRRAAPSGRLEVLGQAKVRQALRERPG